MVEMITLILRLQDTALYTTQYYNALGGQLPKANFDLDSGYDRIIS